MAEANEGTENQELNKRRGCLGWFFRLGFLGLILIAGLAVWLNGPGVRWLGPKVAKHFLEKAEIEGDLKVGGTLLGGIDIYDLDLRSGGALERLVIARLETDYRFSEIIKGKLRGVSGEGLRVDVRLIEKEKEEEKEPVDFVKLGKTLNKIRGLIVPVEMDLREVSVSVKKEGELVVGIAESSLEHQTGSGRFGLKLGMVTDSGGRTVQPQEAEIFWDEGKLGLNRLDLLPIVGLRELEVLLPEDGMVAASGKIRLGEAVLNLDVGAGIEDVRLDLVEGELDFSKLGLGFGLGLPVSGKLTSLALEAREFYPEWQTAVGSVEIFLEDFYYDGWGGPELAIGLTLSEGEIGAKVTGQSLGSPFVIEGKGAFERSKLGTGGLVLPEIGGSLNVGQVESVLAELDKKFDMRMDFGAFPKSELSGKWALDLEGGFESVGAELTLKATEIEASPVRLDASYGGKVLTIRAFETAGRKISGTFDTETQGYKMRESMDGFNTESIAPWLEGVGMKQLGAGVFSLEWEGSGNLLANVHEGALRDFEGTWEWKETEGQPKRPPVSASGSVQYNWPETVEVDGLVIEMEGQKIALDAKLLDDAVELEKFVWMDGDEEIATGEGKLPMPKDFSDFKAFLADDNRPLDLKIRSKVLPLAKLKPWVKGLDQIGDEATGMVDIKVSGSLAEPEVKALLELRGVSVPDRPELPKTDVTLNLDAIDGVAKITGEALAADYAPAILELEMPFLPKRWAEDPESLKMAPISGKLDLPRIDLSRFEALIPGAENLGGIAEGKVTLKGTVGAPDLAGDLNLSGGKLAFKNQTIPSLDGMDIDIKTNLNEVVIKGGIKRVEGGYVDFDGTMAIKEADGRKAGEMDMTLTARGMPVMRNDFLILRANADLRIRGGMADAQVTGDIGIVDSIFFKDMELIPIGKPFLEPSPAKLPGVSAPKEAVSMVPAPFGNWTANVVVKTIDPVLIRGNLGKGDVDVALRVEGKLADPKPNGTVRLRNAVARLPFSTLDVREGTLTFTPATGLDPMVELRGTAEPRPYRVDVYAYGRMSDPQLALTSQPPLPENEIMTLLATGTTSSGLEDSQAASSRALQLLIEELRRGRFLFGKQLRPLLGLLDEVDFSLSDGDPYDTESYNSARLKLSSKWYISAGIGSTGEQRVMAIYRLRFR